MKARQLGLSREPKPGLKDTVQQDLDGRFLEMTIGQKMTPMEAATALGIPYDIWVVRRDAVDRRGIPLHPHIQAAWKFCDPKAPSTVRKALPRSGLEIKEKFRQSLLQDAGYFDKIVGWLARMDPNDPDKDKAKEAQDVYSMTMKNGLLRDILPKESANQHENVSETPFSGKTIEELLRLVKDTGVEVQMLLQQRDQAAAILVKSSKDVKDVRDAGELRRLMDHRSGESG